MKQSQIKNRKSKIRLEFARWHPVTAGEYERETRTIRVNLNAVEELKIPAERIIAHELGHFFAADLNLSRPDEEKFCDEFAARLLEK